MINFRLFCGLYALIFGSITVYGQTSARPPAVLAALTEIHSFEITTLSSLTRPANSLRDEIYGHFYRSQGTLRNAREIFFSSSSKFPYYQLDPDVRQDIMKRLTTIISECIDPTVDYLQKSAILSYFNFMADAKTPIEEAFEPVASQLKILKDSIESSEDDSCIKDANINSRRLTTQYNTYTSAIQACTRSASSTYRTPLNEFTRLNIPALAQITRLNTELNQCISVIGTTLGDENSIQQTNECIKNYLEKYCEDEEKCNVCSPISAVKDQAKNMMAASQEEYKKCITNSSKMLSTTIPFSENLKDCLPTRENEEEGEKIIDEEDDNVLIIINDEDRSSKNKV